MEKIIIAIDFVSTFEYKLIYVFRIQDKEHDGCLKIGDATLHSYNDYSTYNPNSNELNFAARKRIDEYTATAGIIYDLLHTEIAVYYNSIKNTIKAFRDHDVHKVLIRSGIVAKYFDTTRKQNEWFKVDLETVKKAIQAVKNNKSSLTSSDITNYQNPIAFRPEQRKAINDTIKRFKTNTRMLWNAKMRFGKTLSALQVAKEMALKRSLIITHRPVVKKGWFDDFDKIFYDKPDYKKGSKKDGFTIKELLLDKDCSFVYFASIQDLRESDAVGGRRDKNYEIFETEWDFIVIDEAHEGTQTELGKAVIKELIKDRSDRITFVLELSGTPFNLLSNYDQDGIYTWDYIMEQEAKMKWDLEHFGDYNPYSELPKLNIFTYHLEKTLPAYIEVADKAFKFSEFFRVWTGDKTKDFKQKPTSVNVGDFIHEKDVKAFLDLICKTDPNSNYPFSNESYRAFFRHSLWVVPGVKEAKALSKLIRSHSIFSHFEIVNVAGDGDEEIDTKDALMAVKKAIGNNPDETNTITLSCGRLTTGVSVPEWTAVLMLSGSYSVQASQYLQTIFRVQTPANINGKIKENCYVFDFAPDRTLKMVAESVNLSARAGKINVKSEIALSAFLNYCPVISIDSSGMKEYKVSYLLQELKRAHAERVSKNGFDDPKLYNEELLKLTEVELKDFAELKKIVGASKQKSTNNIDINDQGFTEEEYEELEKVKAKNQRHEPLTKEEIERLKELKEKRKNKETAISILRAISIRIPLLIYGMDKDFNDEITIDNFETLIDDISWSEFMPKDVTKEVFNKFKKYYDKYVFIGAGRHIRARAKRADELDPTERIKELASVFSTFKNPDKETVLTPWRVVNLHMSETLGGYDFYDENHENVIEVPRHVKQNNITNEVFYKDTKILEINSKTGLYPLYMAYSTYRNITDSMNQEELTYEKKYQIWDEVVKNNIFVICKTQMARQITKRTLLGYKKGKINAHSFNDLVMQMKDKREQLIGKIKKSSFWNIGGSKQMKFNAVVGNPPYQENKGGTKNIDIWQYFVYCSNAISDLSSLIHPGRWLIPKKNMKDVHDKIISSNLMYFDYYPNASKLFSNVGIDGGITITLYNKKNKGEIMFSIDGKEKQIFNPNEVFFSDEFEKEIFDKISSFSLGSESISKRVYGSIGSLGGGEFGYKKSVHLKHLKESTNHMMNPIKVWANKDFGKGSRFSWNYIEYDKLDNPPKEILGSKKVMIDKKGHAIIHGKGNVINNIPQIVDENVVASGDVLFIVPEKNNDYNLELIKTFFLTKTIRFLMTLIQKDLYVRGFENVPDYTYFVKMLGGSLFTDRFFYKTFNFTKALIDHIENTISEKKSDKL